MNDPNDSVSAVAEDVSLDDFLPYLVNRISNRLNIDLSEDLRTIGLSLPHWRVLAVLNVGDGRNIGELSVYTVIEQSTLSRIIDRMEQAGLVRRQPGRADARVTEVFMTPKGNEALAQIVPIAMKHYRRAVHGLDEAEMATLVRTLHKVLENVRRSPYP